MLAQLGAKLAAVCPASGTISAMNLRTIVAFAAAGLVLGGCVATPRHVASADPADPGVRVAAASYRSTVAPYASLRPVAPSSWRERNDRVAPAPIRSDRGAP